MILLVFSYAYAKEITTPQDERTLDTVLSEMERTEKNIKDLTADIVQTKVFTDFDDTVEFKGVFKYKKPRMMYWEFYSPDRSLIVVNEKETLMYVPDIKQAQKIDVENSPKGISLIFGFDRAVENLKKDFSIALVDTEETPEGKKYVLDLAPIAEREKNTFYKIKIWVRETSWIPEKFYIVELNGDNSTTELFNIKVNSGVPQSQFYLTLPKDVEVVNVDM